MTGDILKGLLWPLVSVICQLFKGTYRLLLPRICSLPREWETTRRNVILKCVFRLLVPPIYSWICEGYTNEDRRYAFLFLALETVSLILDLLGGSHWGYLLASCLLSFLILETTIYAYFISRSRIKSQDRQLIVQEIVFSVLQLIVACYCLIKTLSGAKTNYNSSLFPLASAIISVFFTSTSKNDVSHSSSDPPPNDPPDESVSIPMPTGDAKADPLDKSLDSVHKSDDKEDPLDKSFVYVPSTSASVAQTTTLRRRGKQSHFQVDPLNPTLVFPPTSSSVVFNLRSEKNVSHSSVDTPPDSPSNQFFSVPTSDAEVDPFDEQLVSVPTSDAKVDPFDEPIGSVPTSDVRSDPLAPPPVSVPTSSPIDPPPGGLRQRGKMPEVQADPRPKKINLTGPAWAFAVSEKLAAWKARRDAVSKKQAALKALEPRDDVSKMVDMMVRESRELCQRKKHTQFQKSMFKVDLPNDKAKMEALKTVSSISGVDKNSIQVDTEEKTMTLTATREAVAEHVVDELRKLCHTELISVGPAEQPKTTEEKQSEAKEHFTCHGKHID